MSKIGKSIAKTVFKQIKKFGIRPDDITDMLEEADIDGIIAEKLNELKESETDTIVLAGYYEDSKFKFSAVSVVKEKTEKGTEMRITKRHKFSFFRNEKTDHFTITELISSLLNMMFSVTEKNNK